mgnify:FL=1
MLLERSNPSLAKRLGSYLAQDKNFNSVYHAVQKDFLEADFAAHNWEHIYRDTLNAIAVGETEKADMSIVLPAIVMHDIGFLYGGTGKTHAAVGAEKLPEYLEKIKVSYPPEIVRHITNCIRTHKGNMHNEFPETLEAKVVADADLLEKFGPIGVYQYIRTWTEFKKGIENTIERKNVIIDLRLETETGKKLADRGRKFVIDFFESLEESYAHYR